MEEETEIDNLIKIYDTHWIIIGVWNKKMLVAK